MITLYQMPISHFSEKVRWALAYKRLPHTFKNLLPGLHARTAKKLSGQTAVPVIKEGRNVVHGSADIISFLDKEFPRFSLTPEDEQEAAQAMEWERWADAEIGSAVRVLAYSILLDRPDILKPFMIQDCAWYGRFYIDKAFPKVQSVLRQRYAINEQNIASSKAVLKAASEKQLSAQPDLATLLPSGFSRADIALASLWAPLFRIGKYGIQWPETMPPEYEAFSTEFADIKAWVEYIYGRYR